MNVQEMEQFQRLEELLAQARRDVVSVSRSVVNLTSYKGFKEQNDSVEWELKVVADVISVAETFPNHSDTVRAFCPLCGGSSSSPYAKGFSVPEGLDRHLTGRGANQCVVARAAFQLAWAHWSRKLAKAQALQPAVK